MSKQKEIYLGDGVYGELTPEHIILRTGSHKDSDCDSKIYLEDLVVASLLSWIKHIEADE